MFTGSYLENSEKSLWSSFHATLYSETTVDSSGNYDQLLMNLIYITVLLQLFGGRKRNDKW